MVDIAKIIFSHLASSRSVVVPTLGAFLRKDDGTVIFSELMKKQDGVLRELIKKELSVDDLTADALIDRFCYDVRDRLRESGACVFANYGTLCAERDGSLRFLESVPEPEPEPEPEPDDEPIANARELSLEKTNSARRNVAASSCEDASSRKPGRGTDKIMIAAVVVIALAVLALLYGWYVSTLSSQEEDSSKVERIEVDPSLIERH